MPSTAAAIFIFHILYQLLVTLNALWQTRHLPSNILFYIFLTCLHFKPKARAKLLFNLRNEARCEHEAYICLRLKLKKPINELGSCAVTVCTLVQRVCNEIDSGIC